MTLADLRAARGFNWYGMEDGLRPPSLAELTDAASRGLRYLRVPQPYDVDVAAVQRLLSDAAQAGVWVSPHPHNYGRIGGSPKINATDGVLITGSNQDQWVQKCLDDYANFGRYASWVPLDMNEPSQRTEWEPISRARATALRGAGYTGIIGCSAGARSSAAGINSTHPLGWWHADDPLCFLEVHHYLEGILPEAIKTRATMDAFAQSKGFATYLSLVDKTFGYGMFGTTKWASIPKLVGEFAFPPALIKELHLYLSKVDVAGAGALLWAGGMWGTYPYKMTPEQRNALAAHTDKAGS